MRRLLIVAALPALALAGERPDSLVSLASMTIDVRQPTAGIPDRLAAGPLVGGDVAIVKLPGHVTASQRDELERHATVFAYLPDDAFVVRLPQGDPSVLVAALGGAWIVPYHPAYKVPERVRAAAQRTGESPLIVMLQLFPDVAAAPVMERLRVLGVADPVGQGESRRFYRVRMLLPPAELGRVVDAIAALPQVFWVDVEPRLALLNDTTIWVGQSGVGGGQTTPVFSNGIYGQGQVVGIIDTGIDADMCYFWDAALGVLPPINACNLGTTVDAQQRKVLAVDFLYQNECNGGISSSEWDTQDHGSHVAGTVAGDRGTPLVHDSADGMAPGAKLIMQDGGYAVDNCADLPGIGCPVVNLYQFFNQAYLQGARLHTNSYGDNENASVQNDYTVATQDVDEFMWDHKDFLIFFAAGNSGPGNNTVGTPSTAKSCISVGATARGSSAESMAFFSSCGYTDDNRYKPELTIPGENIVSANNDNSVATFNCGTKTSSGTSMASPAAAGLGALVRQYYTDGFYPTGVASGADAFTPSAALVRATLVNSAQNMTNVGSPIPSRCQGWGRVLLDNALYFPADARKLVVVDDDSFTTGSTGQLDYVVDVVSGSVPFKVTLAWTDYPSTPAAMPHLVNDLDLVVTAPGGTFYTGNVFSGGQSNTGGSADRRNTLEQVLRLAPAAGSYTVRVKANNVPNGPQPFALVITGDVRACPAITVNPATLPNGAVGTPYSQTVSASGGTAPYTFAVTAGSLPPGLGLGSSSGLLSGTPTTQGSYAFTVTASDAAACAGSRAYSVDVVCATITIAPASLPPALIGVAYAQTLGASGGSAPYTYAITSGALPPGLALDGASGAITGTPTTGGSYPFTVAATDAVGCSGSRGYTIAVSCPTVTLAPPTLPSATVGTSYSQALSASGGTSPYAFSVTAGALPAGLTLSSAGLLSGTPATTGTFTFTVTATDAAGCAGSRAYGMDVNPPGCGSISLSPATLPATGEGLPFSQTVSASGGTAPYTYAITAGSLPPGLQLATSSGLISGVASVAGSYPFTVTARDAAACAASIAYTIEVRPAIDAIVGEGLGPSRGNAVRVYTRDGTATAVQFAAYSTGRWGTNVGHGQLDGTGGDEILTGPGPGDVYGPHVRGFDRTGIAIAKVSFFAYGTLRFGANVVGGDLDGDPFAEIVSGAGPGVVFGPHVRAFDYDNATLSAVAKVSFFAFGTLKYGVNVALGTLDVDGFDEILTGAGPGAIFGATVRAFNYDGSATSSIAKVNFNAFATTYGANVAAGDADTDGYDEIATAMGPGPANPDAFAGFDYDGAAVAALAGFQVTPDGTLYGGRVGAGDLSGDGRDDLLCGDGRDPAAPATVRAYEYSGTALALLPGSFTPFSAGYGVNVAGGELGYW